MTDKKVKEKIEVQFTKTTLITVHKTSRRLQGEKRAWKFCQFYECSSSLLRQGLHRNLNLLLSDLFVVRVGASR